MEELFPPSDKYVEYAIEQKQLYHLFGDPSLGVYTQKPKTFNNIDVVAESYNSFTNLFNVRVTVNDNADDVVIFCNDHSMYAQAKRSKSALFYIRDLSNLEIVVSGHNYLPWSQPASVLQSIIQGQQKMKASEESIIDENKVWMYANYQHSSHGISFMAGFDRFNGTKEINGKMYHKLYHVYKEIDTESYEQEDINKAKEELNIIPEFDFDKIEPIYYIRQDGEKYYMLWAEEYFNKDGQIIGDNIGGLYGSNIIETLIYDFSAAPGESYRLIDYDEIPKGWYLYDVYDEYFGFQQYNQIIVESYETIQKDGKEFTRQKNKRRNAEYWDSSLTNIKSIGNLNCLGTPGYYELIVTGSSGNFGLVNVRTLDGEYIYGKPLVLGIGAATGISEVNSEKAEAEYFGVDGKKVAGEPAPGIYIERKGNSVRKW